LRASGTGPEKNEVWAKLDASQFGKPGFIQSLEPGMIAGTCPEFPSAKEVTDA
jgi:hypothetical protein